MSGKGPNTTDGFLLERTEVRAYILIWTSTEASTCSRAVRNDEDRHEAPYTAPYRRGVGCYVEPSRCQQTHYVSLREKTPTQPRPLCSSSRGSLAIASF